MKELFESLAENVSEACYNDIISIVEQVVEHLNKDKYSKGDSILGSMYRALDKHKNLLAQAKSVRRHYKKDKKEHGYNNDIDYNKIDGHVEHELDAVRTLDGITSDGRMQAAKVGDVRTPEGERKQERKAAYMAKRSQKK